MPRYYPINLDVRGRECLVVGGGEVARRKVRSLLDAGACVTVVAPEIHPRLAALAQLHGGADIPVCRDESGPRDRRRQECLRHQGSLALVRRAWRDTDLHNVFLVVVATDDPITNRTVAQDAMDLNLLVNTVDCPALSNFIVPALVRRGDLLIAVSTAGASPSLSRRVRERLEQAFGPEYALWVELLGELRGDVLRRVADGDRRAQCFGELTDESWVGMLRTADLDEVRRKMRDVVERFAGE